VRPASSLPLKANYHDAAIEAIKVGPRREVVLAVWLDPVWNGGDSSPCRLHFSAIENFDEVAVFFQRVSPAPEGRGCVDRIMGVVLVSKGVIGVELDHLGYVEIRGAKVREY
jgi:hypothetical protein